MSRPYLSTYLRQSAKQLTWYAALKVLWLGCLLAAAYDVLAPWFNFRLSACFFFQKYAVDRRYQLASVCPLCNKLRTNDTALSVSGLATVLSVYRLLVSSVRMQCRYLLDALTESCVFTSNARWPYVDLPCDCIRVVSRDALTGSIREVFKYNANVWIFIRQAPRIV